MFFSVWAGNELCSFLASWVHSPALGSHETPAWDLWESKYHGLSSQIPAGSHPSCGSPTPTHPLTRNDSFPCPVILPQHP